MATWTFWDEQNQAEFDKWFKNYDEMTAWLAEHPELKQIPGRVAPAALDPIRLGVTKPKEEFRERMQQIKQHHNKHWTKSTIRDW